MRYGVAIESSAALADNTAFGNLVSAAAAGFKIRRVVLGISVTSAATPTSIQVQVQIIRATARGTSSATSTGLVLDGAIGPASAITGLDTAWSVNPTLAANPLARIPFNSLSGVDLPFEGIEELTCDVGTANGIAFRHNSGGALPANHKLVLTVEWEE